MTTSFNLTKQALETNNQFGIGAARACKANSTTIVNYCYDNGLDLLNPKPGDEILLAEILCYLVSEGFECQNAIESFEAIKH